MLSPDPAPLLSSLGSPLRPRRRCGCCGGSCCGSIGRKALQNQGCCGVAVAPIERNSGAAPRVNQISPHRIKEKPVARRNLADHTSSVDDRRQAAQSLGKRAIWLSTLTPLIVLLLLSLGLWWVVWKLISP
jgi:hypothetical protein